MTDDARFFYVNDAACQALGYSREELLQMTVYDIDPAFTERMWHESWRKLKAKKNIVLETVHQAKDGRIYPVEIRANYLEFGGREYNCAFARDITERKRAETALRESEERQRTILQTATDGFCRVDLQGRLLEVNDAYCRMSGYDEQELLAMSISALEVAETPADTAAHFRNIMARGEDRFETRHRRKDGSCFPVEVSAQYQPADGGYLVAFLRDITERQRAEEALRDKEYLLSESQRIGHIGSWSVDLTTYAATWTPETYRLFGVSPDTFVPSADALIDLLHPEDRDAMREWIRAALAGEHPDVLEFRVVLPDGSSPHVKRPG